MSIASTYRSLQDDNSLLNWMSSSSANMDDRKFELDLIILWSIWNSRNAMVKNGETRTPIGPWQFAEKYYKEIFNIQLGSNSTTNASIQ